LYGTERKTIERKEKDERLVIRIKKKVDLKGFERRGAR